MAPIKASTRRPGGVDLSYIVQLGAAARKAGQAPADERWMAKIPDGKDENGQLLYKRIKRNTREEVIAARDEFLARRKEQPRQALLGRLGKGMTVGAWMEHWLEEVVRLGQTASTYDAYRGQVQRHIVHNALGKVAMSELTQGRIEQWRGELEKGGTTPSVVNYALARLKTGLEEATGRVSETGCKANHARKVKPLATADTVPYVGDPSETLRLIAALGDSYMASLVQVGTDLGLRRSELAALQWGDVDLEGGTVTIKRHLIVSGSGTTRGRRIVAGTKTSKSAWKTLPLSARSVAMLRQTQQQLLAHKLASRAWKAGTATDTLYVDTRSGRSGTAYVVPQHPIAPDALVWPYTRGEKSHGTSVEGGAWDPTTLGNWFKALCERVGIKGKSIHDLRHDCATFLIAAGVPLTVVADHMRHKDASLTASVYAHLMASQERLAVRTQDALWERVYASAAQAAS